VGGLFFMKNDNQSDIKDFYHLKYKIMSLPIIETISTSAVYTICRFFTDGSNPKWRRGLAVRFLYALPVGYLASRLVKNTKDLKILFFGALMVFYSEILENLFLPKRLNYLTEIGEESNDNEE